MLIIELIYEEDLGKETTEKQVAYMLAFLYPMKAITKSKKKDKKG